MSCVAGVVPLLVLVVLLLGVVPAEHLVEEAELRGGHGEERHEQDEELHLAGSLLSCFFFFFWKFMLQDERG